MRRPWIALGISAALVAGTLPYVREHGHAFADKLAKTTLARARPKTGPASPLVGLDLSRIDVRTDVGLAPAGDGRVAIGRPAQPSGTTYRG